MTNKKIVLVGNFMGEGSLLKTMYVNATNERLRLETPKVQGHFVGFDETKAKIKTSFTDFEVIDDLGLFHDLKFSGFIENFKTIDSGFKKNRNFAAVFDKQEVVKYKKKPLTKKQKKARAKKAKK